jgi:hypothetical protein
MMRKRFCILIIASVLPTTFGCTTTSKIYDQAGQEALLIECGAAVSFSVCHKRALQECPQGYSTISEKAGFNRKDLRIRCK